MKLISAANILTLNQTFDNINFI